MKARIIRLGIKGVLAGLCILFAVALVFCIILRIRAVSIGTSRGTELGSLAGKIVGTVGGITTGIKEGAEQGKRDGINSGDIEVKLRSELTRLENLEVLAVGLSLVNDLEMGDRYGALLYIKGAMIYTVDLSQAEISVDSEAMRILLPMPQGTLYLDDEQTEKLSEHQRWLLNGSAEDGYELYITSREDLYRETQLKMNEDDSVMQSAMDAARKTVGQLARDISLNTYSSPPVVEFKS